MPLERELILQVRDNPFGDFRSMYKHISKGSWTFSDRDHGWQVSDYTTESLKVTNSVQTLHILVAWFSI